MNREKELVKNSIILSIGTILPKIASILTIPIITGCLTKSEYGTYDIITILVSLFLPIVTLQMQSAAFRFLIEERKDQKQQIIIITNIFLFTIPISLIALLILYFFLNKIEKITRILIQVYFFIDTLLITSRQVARGLSHNKAYSDSALINSFLELACMYLFLQVYHKGLNGALAALIISQFVSLVYLVFRIRIYQYIHFEEFSFGKIKSLISYSWPMVPNSMSSWVMRVSDRLILTSYLGLESNAVYAVANKLPNIFSIVQSTFLLAWQENASLSVKDTDANEYYGKLFRIVFHALVGIMSLLIAFTPIIYKFLIRGDYSESYNHMPILYIASFYSAISAYLGGIYIAHMKTKQIGITTTIAAVINFIINIVFVRKIGVYAASISTLVSYLLLTIYRMIDIKKFQKIKFNVLEIFLLSILLVGMSFLCFRRNMILDIFNMILSIFIAFSLNKEIVFKLLSHLKKRSRE